MSQPAPVPERESLDDTWLSLAIVIVVMAGLLQITPDRAGVTLFGWRLPEVCAVKRAGGRCPGCGLTRSFVSGVRADSRAFGFHPAGPLLLAFIVAQIPYRGARLLARRRRRARGEPEPAARPPGWGVALLGGAVGVALLVTWGARVGGLL